MTDWTFVGNVLPSRAGISLSPRTVTVHLSGFPEISVWLQIHGGELLAKVVTGVTEPDLGTLRQVVENYSRFMVDYLGYRLGWHLDVDVFSASSSASKEGYFFGVDQPALISQGRRSESPFDVAMDEKVLVALGLAPEMQLILGDFRDAMRRPAGTGFYCYRAIESMMQVVRGDSEKEIYAWERLRSSLNISRKAIDTVKAHADDARHGKLNQITSEDRANVLIICDIIIERYITFLVSGKQQLPIANFPLLEDLTASSASPSKPPALTADSAFR